MHAQDVTFSAIEWTVIAPQSWEQYASTDSTVERTSNGLGATIDRVKVFRRNMLARIWNTMINRKLLPANVEKELSVSCVINRRRQNPYRGCSVLTLWIIQVNFYAKHKFLIDVTPRVL